MREVKSPASYFGRFVGDGDVAEEGIARGLATGDFNGDAALGPAGEAVGEGQAFSQPSVRLDP